MTEPSASVQDLARRLRSIIETVGVKKNGPYRLSKGGTSPYLFDLKPVMLDPEGANIIGKLLLERAHFWRATHVGGRELGAVPLATLVSQESFLRPPTVRGFFVRKQAKDHGLKKLVEGNIPGPEHRVVVVEDVTTSGGSAMDTVIALREIGVTVVGVVTVVDREEGARAKFEAERIPFTALFTLRDFPEILALR